MAQLRKLICYASPFYRATKQCFQRRRYLLSFWMKSLVLAWSPFYVLEAVAPVRHKEETKLRRIIESADDLYNKALYDDLYNLLKDHETSDEPEILWRLSRSIYEISHNVSNIGEKLRMLESALDIVSRALELDENCWAAHKWCGILLDSVWKYKSNKGRILKTYEIKSHFERAIELNPRDSTSYYLLGSWCYGIADLPWYQKKAASVLFAKLPSSSYEEAYSLFEKAEQIEPGFYSMNLLMMGKCLLQMNKKDLAIDYFRKAYKYPLKTPDDKQAHEEAKKFLEELGAQE